MPGGDAAASEIPEYRIRDSRIFSNIASEILEYSRIYRPRFPRILQRARLRDDLFPALRPGPRRGVETARVRTWRWPRAAGVAPGSVAGAETSTGRGRVSRHWAI